LIDVISGVSADMAKKSLTVVAFDYVDGRGGGFGAKCVSDFRTVVMDVVLPAVHFASAVGPSIRPEIALLIAGGLFLLATQVFVKKQG